MHDGVRVYIAVVGFALGIALYSFVSLGWSFIVLLALLASLLFAYTATATGSRGVLTLALFVLCFAAGAARMYVAVPHGHELDSKLGQEVTVTATISDEPQERETHTNLEVQLPSQEKVLVYADKYGSYAYGDTVRIVGVLEAPKSFMSDDSSTSLTAGRGRVFNYPRYLAKDSIYHIIAYPDITVLKHGGGNTIIRLLLEVKHAYLHALKGSLPEPASALAGGITVGAKSSLGEELESDFRKTGIIHIVVLSGYNIVIIITFISLLLARASIGARIVLSALLIVLFAILVGGGATVVRASAMALVSLLALHMGRTYSALRALCVVGAGMLLINPQILIADVSFQLSFIATLGLIFGTTLFDTPNALEAYYDVERIVTSKALALRDIVIATISTQIAVLPLILYYMGDLSLVSIPVNVLVLPVVPMAMLFSALAGVIGMFSTMLAAPFTWVAYLLLQLILQIVDMFAHLPFAAVHVGGFSFVYVVLAYVLLASMFVSIRHKLPVNV